MDDQPGKLIDGTARAHQWRGSRPKAPAGAQGAENRSDAPKSFAGSLLVPAEMLSAAAAFDAKPAGDQQSRATGQLAEPEDPTPGGMATEGVAHLNPFLAPDAGSAGRAASPRFQRWSIAALITRAISATTALPRPPRPPQRPFAASVRRRLPVAPATRNVALALASFAATALVALLVLTQPSNRGVPSVQASIRGDTAGPLGGLKSAPLAAASNPFPARHVARSTASNHTRRAHVYRTTGKHLARRPQASTSAPASKTATVVVRYTPPPAISTSASSTTDAPIYTPSDPSPAPAAPASSVPSTPVHAFGSSGALGPGSSPSG